MDDETKLADAANSLANAFEQSLPNWVMGAIQHRHPEEPTPELRANALTAAEATAPIVAQVRDLLETDIDAQWTSPLAIARQVVGLATGVLEQAGVPPVPRDANAERLHPEDIYDLTPGTFADFGPEVHEPGITWGAAKAYVHLSRRTAEGLR